MLFYDALTQPTSGHFYNVRVSLLGTYQMQLDLIAYRIELFEMLVETRRWIVIVDRLPDKQRREKNRSDSAQDIQNICICWSLFLRRATVGAVVVVQTLRSHFQCGC